MLAQGIKSHRVILALITLVSAGCQPSDSPTNDGNGTSAAAVQTEPQVARAGQNGSGADGSRPHRFAEPDKSVSAFLDALKTGDDSLATSLLTRKAQQEMERTDAAIQPPGSPTADFAVTEIKFLGQEKTGAHVLSTWTDTDDAGEIQTYEIVWILRKENDGWAIAGMATRVFDDQDPLILNFEDPLEAQQKRSAVDREIARRGQQQPRQAQQGRAATMR